jgi:hypothetical protein
LCTEEEGNPSCRVRSAYLDVCKPRGSATPFQLAGFL